MTRPGAPHGAGGAAGQAAGGGLAGPLSGATPCCSRACRAPERHTWPGPLLRGCESRARRCAWCPRRTAPRRTWGWGRRRPTAGCAGTCAGAARKSWTGWWWRRSRSWTWRSGRTWPDEVPAAERLPAVAGRAGTSWAGRPISAPLEHSQLIRDLAGGHRHEVTENMRSDPGIFNFVKWLRVGEEACPTLEQAKAGVVRKGCLYYPNSFGFLAFKPCKTAIFSNQLNVFLMSPVFVTTPFLVQKALKTVNSKKFVSDVKKWCLSLQVRSFSAENRLQTFAALLGPTARRGPGSEPDSPPRWSVSPPSLSPLMSPLRPAPFLVQNALKTVESEESVFPCRTVSGMPEPPNSQVFGRKRA